MINFLEKGLSKYGESIEIYQSIFTESKAVSLMLRCFANLIDLKFNNGNQLQFTNDNLMIWAESNSNPVGGICYTENLQFKSVNTVFVYTDELWQRRNIHRLCHNALENLMRKKNLNHIWSIVHSENNPSIISHERLGLSPSFTKYIKTLD